MFDRFTDRARKVMGLSREAALRWQHDYIGPEHVLLGLLDEGKGVGASALTNLDVDLPALRAEVEERMDRGTTEVAMGQLPFTPRAKKLLESSLEEASRLGHTYIGTEHLLLGMLRSSEGLAAVALASSAVNLQECRAELLKLLGEPPEDAETTGRRPEVDKQMLLDRLDEIEGMLRALQSEIARLRQQLS